MAANDRNRRRKGVLVNRNFFMVLLGLVIVLVIACAVLIGVSTNYKKELNDLKKGGSTPVQSEAVQTTDPTASVTDPAATAPAATAPVGTAYTVTTNADTLNMRDIADIDGQVVDRIPKNTVIYVTTISNGWGFTNYNGKQGWVSMDYLTLSSSLAQTTAPAATSGTVV